MAYNYTAASDMNWSAQGCAAPQNHRRRRAVCVGGKKARTSALTFKTTTGVVDLVHFYYNAVFLFYFLFETGFFFWFETWQFARFYLAVECFLKLSIW